MYTVQISKWVSGQGFSYTTEVDRVEERQTGEEYVRGCIENLRGDGDEPFPWGILDDNEDVQVRVLDEDGEQVGPPFWVSEA